VSNRGCWAQLLALTVGLAFVASTAQTRDKDFFTDPEKEVLAAAVRGEPADFSSVKDSKGRTIRSWVIENLLTGVYKDRKLNRFGFTIQNAIFDGRLNLGSVDVPVTVRLENCTFKDEVVFSSAHFSAPVYLDGSSFTDLMLNSTRVDDNLDIDGITVTGAAQFNHLRVKGDFFARGDKFIGENSTIQFGQAEVNGEMYFSAYSAPGVKYGPSIYEGSLALPEANTPATGLEKVKIEYGPSSFAGSLSLEDVKALKLDLSSVTIKKDLNLGHANIQTVFDVNKLSCFNQGRAEAVASPCLPRRVILEGLTYEDLEGGAEGGVGNRLLELIDYAIPYNAGSYTQLEQYYRAHGEPGQADDVFFHMKEQERNHLCTAHRYLSLLWSYILLCLVHYGRNPEWALYYSFGFVIIGAWIFRHRDDMVSQERDDVPKMYSPFWYSFDLLTPFIDLHLADRWMPRQDWGLGRTYAHLHRILGWILVPIGIAAITGIIK
jgi:hypothetical protein